MNFPILFICLFAAVDAAPNQTEEWTYDDHNARGPHAWLLMYSDCSGKSNSPIDIKTNETVEAVQPDWTLTGWEKTFQWNITDRLDTIRADLTAEVGAIKSKGGALNAEYSLLQFHFHWGKNDSRGSEHEVDGFSYTMEMHAVHMKSKFKSVKEALASNEADALAVLGFFFQIQPTDNKALANLVDVIEKTGTNESTYFKPIGSLLDIVGDSINSSFWRYYGSLTTPSCSEEVIWTIFSKPIGISTKQMMSFRNADHGDFGTELYRPIQQSKGRFVIHYTKPIAEKVPKFFETIYKSEDDHNMAHSNFPGISFAIILMSVTCVTQLL